MPGLADAVEAIADAIGDAAEDAKAEIVVETVIRGDRARPMPALPALWVIPEPATADQAEYGDSERWSIPIRLIAIVKDDSGKGAPTARQIAARAHRVVMRDRRLGLDYVIDTKSLTFDPTPPAPENKRNLFRADARVNVLFDVIEDDS